MKATENLKLGQRRVALTPLGVHADQSRLFESQQGAMFSTGALLRLPPQVGEPLQDGAGVLYFMVDFDPVDSAPIL